MEKKKKKIISLDQQRKMVQVAEFEMNKELIFNYFNSLSVGERDDMLLKAIYIGVLALREDRLSAFLSRTQNELGTELENLKMMFDFNMEVLQKSTIKGTMAEEEIARFLQEYLKQNKMKDDVSLTGSTSGNIEGNKTGDILCIVNNDENRKIVIECKYDKSLTLGEIESKNPMVKQDTAWSQLIESQANRGSRTAIIVFDRASVNASLEKEVVNVSFIPSVGFICIVDSRRGDYSNLAIAYKLARDIVLNAGDIEVDIDQLKMIVNRIIIVLTEIMQIKSMVGKNIDNNLDILKKLEKSMMLIEFHQEYLRKFLEDGQLTAEDLLGFYSGLDLKERYGLAEKEIEASVARD